MTKNEIIVKLTEMNVKFDKKLKKDELFELLQNCENSKNEIVIVSQNELIVNENIEFENVSQNETIVENMSNNYIQFLNDNNLQFEQKNDNFIVICNKKHIFVNIDNDMDICTVFTILNKKMTNNVNECLIHKRNILTLKSLKALKSYTISNSK